MKLRWQATRGTCLYFLKRDPQAAEMRAAPTLRSITAPELDFSKILELHIEMTDQMPVCLGIVTLETGCDGCARKGQRGAPQEGHRARVIA